MHPYEIDRVEHLARQPLCLCTINADKFKLVKRVTVTSVSDPNSTIAKGARRQILSDQIVSQPTQVPNFQGSVERKRKAFKHRVDAASGKRIKYNGILFDRIWFL
jgi:hypothetical protein